MKKWLAPMTLCVAYSGSIFLSALLAKELFERGIFSKKIAFGVFFLVIFGILFTMVIYAFKNSHKR